MVIKFSCDKIQDISKLYKKLVSDSSEADYSYQGTNYCTLLLSDVVSNIASLTSYLYKGIKDRNANEAFVVQCWRRAEQPLKGRRKTTNFGQTKKPTTQFTQFIVN